MTFVYSPPVTDPLPVLFYDDAIIIVNKPAGLLSVPGRLETHKDSMEVRLQGYYSDALTVHRLDMDTSGLMVFARGKSHHRTLSMMFEAREIHKRYLAKILGVPCENNGIVSLPIITDWPNRPRQMVDEARGKPSETKWRILQRYGDHSLVELTPVTGRSHQLRVHMAEIGHPILGDPLYGHEGSRSKSTRLCLHASELGFRHPETGEELHFQSTPEF